MDCLLDEIQTDSLGTVKKNITQDRKPRREFERCFIFYTDFIKQSSGNQSNEARRVAEVGSNKKGNDDIRDW